MRPRSPERRCRRTRRGTFQPVRSWPSQLNSVSRTRSGVGRRPGRSGTGSRLRRHVPPMMRISCDALTAARRSRFWASFCARCGLRRRGRGRLRARGAGGARVAHGRGVVVPRIGGAGDVGIAHRARSLRRLRARGTGRVLHGSFLWRTVIVAETAISRMRRLGRGPGGCRRCLAWPRSRHDFDEADTRVAIGAVPDAGFAGDRRQASPQPRWASSRSPASRRG